ncbi:MAG: rhodanese-like domain-containing protein [Bacillaceae bacterium]
MFDNITVEGLKEKLQHGDHLNIIDVREPSETAMGMIEGAVNIPLMTIPESLNQLNKEDTYYIICHAGGRSLNACNYLGEQGYKVVNVIEGMSAWE